MSFDLTRTDTICALATANAPAAIALVRVSGPAADAVRARVFVPRRPPQRPFVVTLGDVVDATGVVDEALCTAFVAPRSYTGEPGFELSVHGGPVAVRATLKALLAAGCRLAEPGELTLRAVLSGRMGLSAAEAVDDVIGARTDAALRAAQRALHGGVAAALDAPRARIVDVLAELEARLDFPDEDLGDARTAELGVALQDAAAGLRNLLATAARGDRLRRGARVVLYGAPNAGKSTLLNALVGQERALVHEEPGTTRDVIEAAVEIAGMEVTLVDVAGVRDLELAGAVEQQGIRRALQERAHADLVLALVPADDPSALAALERMDPSFVRVATKTDLHPAPLPLPEDVIAVCAPRGSGLDALRASIAAHLTEGGAAGDDVVLMRERHVRAVSEALDAVGRAGEVLRARAPHELVASELRSGLSALDRLLGRDVSAEVLDAIFSRFCIGK